MTPRDPEKLERLKEHFSDYKRKRWAEIREATRSGADGVS